MVLNAQSTISVISSQNRINKITSQSLFTVPDISQSFFGVWGVWGRGGGKKMKQTELGRHKLVGYRPWQLAKHNYVMQGYNYIPTPR